MQDTGLYVGKSHAEGGIPAVHVETGQMVEIEGEEYKICKEAYESSEVLSYENKTNREILDDIHTNFSCKFDQSKIQNGEFILCKLVVNDPSKHTRKGTVRQILDEMQSEKSCRVSYQAQAEQQSSENQMKQGGLVLLEGYEQLEYLLFLHVFNK